LRRELLIAAGPGEWRAALLEAGVPVELYVERGDRAEAGSIHLGRVLRLVPALGAALVDLGDERPAFLPGRETEPRGRTLHDGQRVIVQIRREAQGGKAARATERVRLRSAIGASKASAEYLPRAPRWRGEDWGEQEPEPEPLAELGAEEVELRRRWRDILDRAARLVPPARLDPAASFASALAGALAGPPHHILVDDPAAIPGIRVALSNIAVEHLPETEWPIELDAAFAEALSETVPLPGVGAVHFESTRAGVLIDVDSGTAETGSPERIGLATNLAATAAIARQIRLRNLGGGIVIDFIGLDSRTLREKLRAALDEAIAPDPADPQILGWTRLGHFELVRPRRGRPLTEALLELRPGGGHIKTAITVAYEVLRALRREARARPGRRWRLIVAPEVAVALARSVEFAVQETERRFARKLVIEADPSYDCERFQIASL
jgi:ribonuclease G